MQYNTKMILYHNKNCSKSRECLNILKNQDTQFEIRDYIKEKLSIEEITHIIENLNSSVDTLIRDKKLFNTQECKKLKKLCFHLFKNPKNMQRPIFYDGKNYTICRPPEIIKKVTNVKL